MRVKAHQLESIATNVGLLTRKPQVLQQSYQILCWQLHAIHQCLCLPTPVCDLSILFGYASLLKKKNTQTSGSNQQFTTLFHSSVD